MSQKTLIFTLSALTVTGLGLARHVEAGDQGDKTAPEGKSAEVVTVNVEDRSITVKKPTADASGVDSETLAVEGKALASLKDFNVGDKVVLTCKDETGAGAATGSEVAKPEGGSEVPSPSAKSCVVTDIAKAAEK